MALHDPRPEPYQADHEIPTALTFTPPGVMLANGTLYNLFAVGGMLGHRGRAVGWLCRLVDAMVAHDGFPQPLPLRTREGVTSRAAHRDSRWPSVAVDAWLAAQTPPALVEAAHAGVLAAASARLDARAAGLTLIEGGRA